MNHKFRQRHEDVERKRDYCHIIIFPERLEILHQERWGVKPTIMEHFIGILFHKSGPAKKQLIKHSLTHDKLKWFSQLSWKHIFFWNQFKQMLQSIPIDYTVLHFILGLSADVNKELFTKRKKKTFFVLARNVSVNRMKVFLQLD